MEEVRAAKQILLQKWPNLVLKRNQAGVPTKVKDRFNAIEDRRWYLAEQLPTSAASTTSGTYTCRPETQEEIIQSVLEMSPFDMGMSRDEIDRMVDETVRKAMEAKAMEAKAMEDEKAEEDKKAMEDENAQKKTESSGDKLKDLLEVVAQHGLLQQLADARALGKAEGKQDALKEAAAEQATRKRRFSTHFYKVCQVAQNL